MKLISIKINKIKNFFMCAINIISKNEWIARLKDKKAYYNY